MALIKKIKTFQKTYDTYSSEDSHQRFVASMDSKIQTFIREGWDITDIKMQSTNTERKAFFLAFIFLSKEVEENNQNSIESA